MKKYLQVLWPLLAALAVLYGAPALAFTGEFFGEFADREALIRIGVFIAFGLAGMWLHYLKKWLRGEIRGSLRRYAFHTYPRHTALAVLTFFGGAWTVFIAGQLDSLTLAQLISAAVTGGYTVDSAINKGDPTMSGGAGRRAEDSPI